MIKAIKPSQIHKRQQAYSDRIKAEGFDFGLTVAQAFVESIRDLGYRSTGSAIDELIDNSAEAGAENVHVVFGYPAGSRKPDAIAVIDDGVGMVRDMIRASVVWGGTDRHDSRDLFGRYGYGLPSASVSQGRSFTVNSRVDTQPFNSVTLDLDNIRDGKYIKNGRVTVPEAQPGELPEFVGTYIAEEFPGGPDAARTVVVLEKLDRLTNRQSEALQNHLMETFGITYRNHLRRMSIVVNGTPVQPVDPLFVTDGARFYDVDDDRAEAIEPITFEVRDRESRESLGTVTVRMSVMPPTFARVDKAKDAVGKNRNKRFPILRDHNGLIVLRAGRQIDVVTKGLPTTFVNYDRYIGIEIDFPPSVDELFGVTTHKQQITLSEHALRLLNENNVWTMIDRLRARAREMRADLEADWGHTKHETPTIETKRPSEIAMEEATKLDPVAPTSERRSRMSDEGREDAVQDLVDKGVPRPEAERVIESVEKERPFRVEIDRVPEGPFYRVDLRGGQLMVLINSAHRFYTDIYAAVPGPEGARIRQALEVLLFVIGKCEMDATDDRQLFYAAERQEWSKRLHIGLAKLGAVIDLSPEEAEATDEVPAEGAIA
jgi:hypothetical protein